MHTNTIQIHTHTNAKHTVIKPADDVGKQALQAQAEDLAIEDTIVALDKALEIGIQGLTVETYLKQVCGCAWCTCMHMCVLA